MSTFLKANDDPKPHERLLEWVDTQHNQNDQITQQKDSPEIHLNDFKKWELENRERIDSYYLDMMRKNHVDLFKLHIDDSIRNDNQSLDSYI